MASVPSVPDPFEGRGDNYVVDEFNRLFRRRKIDTPEGKLVRDEIIRRNLQTQVRTEARGLLGVPSLIAPGPSIPPVIRPTSTEKYQKPEHMTFAEAKVFYDHMQSRVLDMARTCTNGWDSEENLRDVAEFRGRQRWARAEMRGSKVGITPDEGGGSNDIWFAVFESDAPPKVADPSPEFLCLLDSDTLGTPDHENPPLPNLHVVKPVRINPEWGCARLMQSQQRCYDVVHKNAPRHFSGPLPPYEQYRVDQSEHRGKLAMLSAIDALLGGTLEEKALTLAREHNIPSFDGLMHALRTKEKTLLVIAKKLHDILTNGKPAFMEESDIRVMSTVFALGASLLRQPNSGRLTVSVVPVFNEATMQQIKALIGEERRAIEQGEYLTKPPSVPEKNDAETSQEAEFMTFEETRKQYLDGLQYVLDKIEAKPAVYSSDGVNWSQQASLAGETRIKKMPWKKAQDTTRWTDTIHVHNEFVPSEKMPVQIGQIRHPTTNQYGAYMDIQPAHMAREWAGLAIFANGCGMLTIEQQRTKEVQQSLLVAMTLWLQTLGNESIAETVNSIKKRFGDSETFRKSLMEDPSRWWQAIMSVNACIPAKEPQSLLELNFRANVLSLIIEDQLLATSGKVPEPVMHALYAMTHTAHCMWKDTGCFETFLRAHETITERSAPIDETMAVPAQSLWRMMRTFCAEKEAEMRNFHEIAAKTDPLSEEVQQAQTLARELVELVKQHPWMQVPKNAEEGKKLLFGLTFLMTALQEMTKEHSKEMSVEPLGATVLYTILRDLYAVASSEERGHLQQLSTDMTNAAMKRDEDSSVNQILNAYTIGNLALLEVSDWERIMGGLSEEDLQRYRADAMRKRQKAFALPIGSVQWSYELSDGFHAAVHMDGIDRRMSLLHYGPDRRQPMRFGLRIPENKPAHMYCSFVARSAGEPANEPAWTNQLVPEPLMPLLEVQHAATTALQEHSMTIMRTMRLLCPMLLEDRYADLLRSASFHESHDGIRMTFPRQPMFGDPQLSEIERYRDRQFEERSGNLTFAYSMPTVEQLQRELFPVRTVPGRFFPGVHERENGGQNGGGGGTGTEREQRFYRFAAIQEALLQLHAAGENCRLVVAHDDGGRTGAEDIHEVKEGHYLILIAQIHVPPEERTNPEDEWRDLGLRIIVSDDANRGTYVVHHNAEVQEYTSPELAPEDIRNRLGGTPIRFDSDAQFGHAIQTHLRQQRDNPVRIYPMGTSIETPLTHFPGDEARYELLADFTQASALAGKPMEELTPSDFARIESGDVVWRFGGTAGGTAYLDRLAREFDLDPSALKLASTMKEYDQHRYDFRDIILATILYEISPKYRQERGQINSEDRSWVHETWARRQRMRQRGNGTTMQQQQQQPPMI